MKTKLSTTISLIVILLLITKISVAQSETIPEPFEFEVFNVSVM